MKTAWTTCLYVNLFACLANSVFALQGNMLCGIIAVVNLFAAYLCDRSLNELDTD